MESHVKPFGRIGILMGGYSSEREISLKSGKAIDEALNRQGFDAVPLDITDKEEGKITSFIREAGLDLAFIALHGHLGEDGTIQSILEELEIPYAGSGVAASRLALDKAAAQDLFRRNNIRVPPHVTFLKQNESWDRVLVHELDFFPVVVKPACEGSSIGISLVREPESMEEALQKAWQYGEKVLVEQYIQGREMTVGILGQRALPVVEIRSSREFFDFTAKYSQGMSDYIVPAQIPDALALRLQETALKAHRILGCEDISRADFILAPDGVHYILEVNTVPGFTATSLLPKAAKQIGIEFDSLCVRLVELAYGKKKKTKHIASK